LVLAHFTKEVVFLGLREVWVSLSLPPSAGFGAFEKIKCIFSFAPVGNLEKLRECFALRNTHRTLVLAAPDAGPECPVWCLWLSCAERTGRWHRTLGGYCSSVRWCVTSASAHEEFLTGEHRTLRVRPVACVR